MERPVCHIVAGPNGSGKSTFALEYLPEYAGSIEYVNPDLTAQGMYPVDISLSAIKAGRLTLARLVSLRDYAALADTVLVFDAVPPVQRLIWRRNGSTSEIVPDRAAAMRKDLGL